MSYSSETLAQMRQDVKVLMLRLILFTAILVAIGFGGYNFANAHEEPQQNRMTLGGGIICDKYEDVLAYIHNPTGFPPSCGRLMGQRIATVTMLKDYIYYGLRFHMAQYEFEGIVPWGVPIQFGFFGNPEPTGEEVTTPI